MPHSGPSCCGVRQQSFRIGETADTLPTQGADFKLWTPWNGEAYRAYVMKNAEAAAKRLGRSRFWGITTAVLVSVAALVVLFLSSAHLGKDHTQPSQVVVVTTSGELVFGELVKAPEGRVTVGDQEVPDAAQVVLLKAGA